MNRVVNSTNALGLVFAVIFAIVAVAGFRLVERIEQDRRVTIEELYKLTEEDLADYYSGEETDPTRLLLDGTGLGLVLKGEYPREVTGEIDEEKLVSMMGRVQDAFICQPQVDDKCQTLVGDDKVFFDFINQTYSDWYLDNSEGRRCMASSSTQPVAPGATPVVNPIEVHCN